MLQGHSKNKILLGQEACLNFKEVVENVSFEKPKGRYFKVSLNPDRCNNMRYVESHGSARCSTLELELDPLVVFI